MSARVDKDIDVAKLVPTDLGQDAHPFSTRHGSDALANHDKLDVAWVEEAPSTQYPVPPRGRRSRVPPRGRNGNPHVEPL
jgi:hypothetical protein